MGQGRGRSEDGARRDKRGGGLDPHRPGGHPPSKEMPHQSEKGRPDQEHGLDFTRSREKAPRQGVKKDSPPGPKSDISQYDLHSHKVAIVDDIQENFDDLTGLSFSQGEFVEVTSRRQDEEKH